jgi:hypothetical protein
VPLLPALRLLQLPQLSHEYTEQVLRELGGHSEELPFWVCGRVDARLALVAPVGCCPLCPS